MQGNRLFVLDRRCAHLGDGSFNTFWGLNNTRPRARHRVRHACNLAVEDFLTGGVTRKKIAVYAGAYFALY